MNNYMPKCFRELPKKKTVPRVKAIKEAKIEVLNLAIEQIRDDMRKYKSESDRKGHYLAISKISKIRDEIK